MKTEHQLQQELTVHLTSLSERTDADIAEAAKNVLEWTSSLRQGAIEVMVEGVRNVVDRMTLAY